MFSDYAYFSSYSDTWLQHAKRYTDYMIERFHVDPSWQVVEIASNDGYLLQYFKEKNIPILGIEPAENIAEVARNKGIPTLSVFFGKETAEKLRRDGITANLILGNNVLAHVPDLNDFIGGIKILLAPEGIVTLEFPHLLQFIKEKQFDTIYQEHFSYFSLFALQKIFAKHAMVIFDVEEFPVHGGSLRLFVKHRDDVSHAVSERVDALLTVEKKFGLDNLEAYKNFEVQVKQIKKALCDFLVSAKAAGKIVAGYGAPAKGNTLLNYCGIKQDLLSFTVDRSPHKQNHYLPGTHISIRSPDVIKEVKPDYLLILPWNLKEEIMDQMSYIKEWGGKFVVAIPQLEIM